MENPRSLAWNPAAEKLLSDLQELRTSARTQEVVAWILKRLENIDDLASRVLLLSELAGEYSMVGDFENAERALRERIAISNDAASSWISLADHHLYATGNLHAARTAIERALRQALNENSFIRQAAGTRIRVALALRDYPYVEDTLRLLMTEAAKSSAPDTAYETDFVRRIPPGTVNTQMIENYMKLARRNQGQD
jgi:tetratricopeptide (TPR) repeat protein